MSVTLEVVDGDIDEAPETEPEFNESPDGLYCVTCQKPLKYGGRGPKPKYCDDHKKSRSTGSKSSGGTRGADTTARSAAALLARLNSLVGMGLIAYGLPRTAVQIAEANETFQGLAYEALLNDPKLAKKIVSGGATSGKAGLLMAYGMLATSVGPAAFMEIKEQRKEADAA